MGEASSKFRMVLEGGGTRLSTFSEFESGRVPRLARGLFLFPKRIVVGPFHQELGPRLEQWAESFAGVRIADKRIFDFSAAPPCLDDFEPVLGEDSHGFSWVLGRLNVR